MARISNPGTAAERIADLEAQVAALNEKIEDLEGEVERLETDAEERSALQVPAYRTLLDDLDNLFGLRNLPFALRLSLDAFGKLL